MASLSKELFDWISAQVWKPPTFKFNVGRGTKTPLVTMIPLASEEEKNFLTSKRGGESTYQFDIYEGQIYVANERADELKEHLMYELRGSLPTYNVWSVRSSTVVGFRTERKTIFRYTFTITFRWDVDEC